MNREDIIRFCAGADSPLNQNFQKDTGCLIFSQTLGNIKIIPSENFRLIPIHPLSTPGVNSF